MVSGANKRKDKLHAGELKRLSSRMESDFEILLIDSNFALKIHVLLFPFNNFIDLSLNLFDTWARV